MNIVFLDSYSLSDVDMSPVSSRGHYTAFENTDPEDVVSRSLDADVIITNKVKITKDVIEKLPRLKLICVAATGVNNVDVDYAESRGIAVRNVPGYSTESVAEATFAFALALIRNLRYYDTYVKDGSYSRSGLIFHTEKPISEIRGKEWGIIGLGAIGRRVAEIAGAFGASVSYHSTSGGNLSGGYTHKSLDELLSGSDIISIHAPLNAQTQNLINYCRLKLMKPTSFLINAGRGGIVNEADLARAIDEGVIAGAGIDVFSEEPISADNPLLAVKDKNRLIMAPHCGWASAEARETLVRMIAANIEAFAAILPV